jgi:hypothetical protein
LSASVPVVLIVVGIVLALLVSSALGGLLILVGLVLLLVPYLRGGPTTRTTRM